MTQPSVWDDPELKQGGEFVEFNNLGDTVSGTIDLVRTHRFDDGKVVPQILLTTDAGEERTLTAGQIRLKAELSELRPEAGDHLKVTLVNIEKRSGGKTLKHFEVEVLRRGTFAPPAAAPAAVAQPVAAAPAPTAAVANAAAPVAPAAPAVDPAAAAAALAALTPEQRAALGLG